MDKLKIVGETLTSLTLKNELFFFKESSYRNSYSANTSSFKLGLYYRIYLFHKCLWDIYKCVCIPRHKSNLSKFQRSYNEIIFFGDNESNNNIDKSY